MKVKVALAAWRLNGWTVQVETDRAMNDGG